MNDGVQQYHVILPHVLRAKPTAQSHASQQPANQAKLQQLDRSRRTAEPSPNRNVARSAPTSKPLSTPSGTPTHRPSSEPAERGASSIGSSLRHT